MATAVLASVNVPTSTSSHFHMPSHRVPPKPSATSAGASSSRLPPTPQPPTATISVSAAPGAPEPAPKTFHRIRSSLEQSLRTATRSKKTAQPVVSNYLAISDGAGKGKERVGSDDGSKDKSKASVWKFGRSGRQSVTPSTSPIPPSPVPDQSDRRAAGYLGTLRQGSLSSPALHLYSQALPSPRSQPAIPASSSSTSDALVSPTRKRTRRPSLRPLQRNLSDLPPTPVRERVSRHRATKSNPLNAVTTAPTAPMRVPSSPTTPRRPTREPPPTLPDTPTPMSGSRGHIARASSSSTSESQLKSAPLSSSVPSGTSAIRPRSPSQRRVVTPLRGLSSSSPVSPSSGGRRPSKDPPSRHTSIDSPRRVSIDSPRRPSFRDESPPPGPRRTPSKTSLSPPSNPEHRDLIRTATSMLCKEVVKPPLHMSRTEAGLKDWEEVEMRVRALARLERIWGKSGIGESSSNLTVGTPAGVSVGGEERERRLFTEALRDGFVLCQLMNKLRSGSILRPDSRDDGFVRTSNITKFLAACSSYGLPNEDLFQRDDLIEATSESLARVARTIIALIKYVDAPIVELVSVQSNNRKVSSPTSSVNPYGQGTSRTAAASTPNLNTASPIPHARPRWSPPSDLPSVRSNSPDENSSASSGLTPTAADGNGNNQQQAVSSLKIDREFSRDKETLPILSPPPKSPLRPQSPKVEDEQNGLFTWAMNHVSPKSAGTGAQSDPRNREEITPGTFAIYSYHDEILETPECSFTTNDLTCVQANMGMGGCFVSVHEPAEAASWIEENWENLFLTSIRNSGCGGPFACMLSPTEPALAIFGYYDNPVVVNIAESLAGLSGFPVVIRPPTDNPALTLLSRDVDPHNAPVQFRDTAGNNGQRRSGGNGDEDEVMVDGRTPGDSGDGGRRDDGGDRAGSHESGPNTADDQGRHRVVMGGVGNDGGGGGDGDGGGPTTMDGKWESQLHTTRVKLRLKLNTAHTYAVSIAYDFKFTINQETEIPIDLEDMTRPLSQPEVVALVDFEIETRPRETQLDRSYASIGFVAHRTESINKRKFLHRGFDLPDKLYKRGQQQQSQRGFQAAVGFSQGTPLGTATFSYNRSNNAILEATDSKVMPRCRVEYETGDEWDEGSKSYSSYNITYQLQDTRLDAERSEFHPLEVKVGMGINLRPAGSEKPLPQISFINRNQVLIWVSDPTLRAQTRGILVLMSSYLDDIRTEEKLSIYEQEEVILQGGPLNIQREDHKPGTISLSIAQVQNQSAPGSNKFALAVPAFFSKFGQRSSVSPLTSIPPHEYLARGWDANNNEWRSVLWPTLDKHFRAADLERTSPVWKIQPKWTQAQTTRGTSIQP